MNTLYAFFKNRYHTRSSKAYIKYLRSIGCKVGNHTIIYEPAQSTIDITRPYLVKIGDFVKITKGVTILTHGYDWSVLRKEYGEILASAGKVTIGNNVFIGMNTTILKGTVIGNNVIIGANSLVSKDIPNNVVAAGNPAKTIMTLDEYLIKRRKEYIFEAKMAVRSFYETYGVLPDMSQLIDFFPLYARRDIDDINKSPAIKNILTDEGGIDEKLMVDLFLATNSKFESYKQFLDWCLMD